MKVSIISLGWLGKALYHHLEQKDFNIWGSYCHHQKEGISQQAQYNFIQDPIPSELQDSDVLFFNLTPSTIASLDHLHKFLYHIKTKQLIFISSTSVYGTQGKVDENTLPHPTSSSGQFLLSCEKMIREKFPNASIIRPSGLYGHDRHPAKYLSGRTSKSPGKQSLNLISQKDLIHIIEKVIEFKTPLVNASNSHHPSKKDYYTDYCKRHHLELPQFNEDRSHQDKIITTKYAEYQVNSPLP